MHNKRALLPRAAPPAPTLAPRGSLGPRPQLELAPGPEVSRYPEGGGGRGGNNWAAVGKTRGPQRQDCGGGEHWPCRRAIGQGRPAGQR